MFWGSGACPRRAQPPPLCVTLLCSCPAKVLHALLAWKGIWPGCKWPRQHSGEIVLAMVDLGVAVKGLVLVHNTSKGHRCMFGSGRLESGALPLSTLVAVCALVAHACAPSTPPLHHPYCRAPTLLRPSWPCAFLNGSQADATAAPTATRLNLRALLLLACCLQRLAVGRSPPPPGTNQRLSANHLFTCARDGLASSGRPAWHAHTPRKVSCQDGSRCVCVCVRHAGKHRVW